jgi:glucosamine-phosphate N-acetyltransferase
MINFEYSSLIKIINENLDNIEEIKTNYIQLLSLLTSVENLSNDDFVNKIIEISKIGEIMVCYYKNLEDKIIIVGTGTVIYEPKIIHSCKYVGHIEDIVVKTDYRYHGMARNIIKQLINSAKENNCYKVILDCKPHLTAFYERSDFTIHGTQMSKYF